MTKRKKNAARQSASKSTEEVERLAKTMQGESDRGCLLVCLAEIDNYLKEILLLYLGKGGAHKDAEFLLNSGAESPIATVNVRTRLARCLGLITPELTNVIDAIRAIRNDQAHGTADFEITDRVIAKVLDSWSDSSRQNLFDIARGIKRPNKPRLKLTLSVGWVLMGLSAAVYRMENSVVRIDFTPPPRKTIIHKPRAAKQGSH